MCLTKFRSHGQGATQSAKIPQNEQLWSLWKLVEPCGNLLENNSSTADLPKEWNPHSYATYLELIPVERPLNYHNLVKHIIILLASKWS